MDEQDRSQLEAKEPQPEAEEASAQPFITLLEKLAMKIDKLEAPMEKLTTNIT